MQFKEPFEISLRRAAFGWPFYVTWNLVVHTRQQRSIAAKVETALGAVLFVILTTAPWAAFWLTDGWLVWQMVSLAL
jgi:hypothetical protein